MIQITAKNISMYLVNIPAMTTEKLEADYKFLNSFMERTNFERDALIAIEDELMSRE